MFIVVELRDGIKHEVEADSVSVGPGGQLLVIRGSSAVTSVYQADQWRCAYNSGAMQKITP